jgi:hypothetical protein
LRSTSPVPCHRSPQFAAERIIRIRFNSPASASSNRHSSDFFARAGEIESLVPAWLRAIEAGCRIGGTVLDEGLWLDLGDLESLPRGAPPGARRHSAFTPKASVDPSANIDDVTSIGTGLRHRWWRRHSQLRPVARRKSERRSVPRRLRRYVRPHRHRSA